MRSTPIAIAVLALMGCTANAEEPKVSPADLAQAHLYLQQTQNLVRGATKGLSKAQWNFKPAPDRWSIAEIVEHMVLAQEYILGPVREQLAKAPPVRERDARREDEVVLGQMPDRTRKFPAPSMLVPTGRWTPTESMGRLVSNYAELSQYLDTTPDLREHVVEALAVKAISKGEFDSIDGYQAVLLVAAHTERHTKQILEVRADANFPSK